MRPRLLEGREIPSTITLVRMMSEGERRIRNSWRELDSFAAREVKERTNELIDERPRGCYAPSGTLLSGKRERRAL